MLAIISIKSVVAVSVAAVSPWPVPLKVVNSGNVLTISKNFKVVASTKISAASMLARVIARYQRVIRSQTQSPALASALSQVGHHEDTCIGFFRIYRIQSKREV